MAENSTMGLPLKLLVSTVLVECPKLIVVFTCDLTECLNCGVRVGQQYVEGRKGACFEALSINSLSSASNVDSGAS